MLLKSTALYSHRLPSRACRAKQAKHASLRAAAAEALSRSPRTARVGRRTHCRWKILRDKHGIVNVCFIMKF